MRHTLVAALLWLLAPVCAAHAQTSLVLSGGGARGLAHAGVLSVLEELGYDPDIVVGTSMGSIVGALYAAGYSAEEIRARILAVEWHSLFQPTPLMIGPSREARWPMATVGFDARRQRVQRGLVGVWRINRALVQMLFEANVRARGDFDRLPRRYRAIATDLRTGEVVTLARGDLARAARSSMAFPGFFAPIEWDDRVLTDGGVADNLSIGTARILGARHVIAVDVSRSTPELRDLAPLAIVQRALNLMQENMQRAIPPADVLIVADIAAGMVGMGYPDDPSPLIARGEVAARRDLPALPSAEQKRGLRTLPPPPRTFGGLIVQTPDSALAALTRDAFADIVGQPFDLAAVLAAVDRVYETGLVEAVWPHVREDEAATTDAPTLVVRVEALPPITLDASVGFENDRGGRAWGSVTRYIAAGHRPVLMSFAASTNGIDRDAALSASLFLRSRLPLALSIGTYARENNARFFEEDVLGTADIVRAGGWTGIEFPRVLRDRITTAVMRVEWVDVESAGSGMSFGPLLRFSALNPEALIVGVPLLVEAERRWGEVSYTRIAVRGSGERALGSLHIAAVGDVRAVSAAAPLDVQPALGDEHALPGLRWGQQRSSTRAVAGFDAALPVRTGYARVRVRTGAVAPTVRLLDDAEWLGAADITALWRTPIGMIEAGYGITSRGHGRFDVSIGRKF